MVRQLSQQKFVRDALGLSVARGMNLAIGVVSMLIYGVVFTKPQIAVIGLFEMVMGLCVEIGVTWSAVGIIRFGKSELQDQQRLCYTSSTRLYLMLPILILAATTIAVFRDQVLAYIGSDDPRLIWWLVIGLLLIAAHNQLTNLFTAREMHHANAMFYVAQSAGRLTVVAAFYLDILQPSALRFVSAIVCLDALWMALRLPACSRPYAIPLMRVRQEDLWKFLRYTAPQLYGFAGLYVINWIDIYFIRMHGTMDELGAYQFMYGIFVKLCAFAILLNSLLFPRVMDWKQTRIENISRLARQGPPAVFLVVSIACGTLLVIFPYVFDLFFGKKYEMAYPSFTLLICALPFCFLTYLFVPVLNSFDRVSTIQWINIFSAGCNLLLDYLLVPRYGIVGAALATFIAFAVIGNLLMYAVHQLFSVRAVIMSSLSLGIIVFAAFYFLSAISQ